MRAVILLSLLLVLPSARALADDRSAPEFSSEQIEFFEREVRPLLVAHCYECHSAQADKLQGGLHLDSRAAILAGGDTGPAAVVGSADESLLIDAINYGDLYQMPPKSKLSDEQISVFRRWVEMGLPWPAEQASGRGPSDDFDLADRKAAHWAWQPLSSAPPAVADVDWPRDDLDRYILAQLEANNLRPATEADRRTWIRRVYFDLIGLPPSAEQVRQFLEDQEPNAYEKVVDQLLDSPHFGERWARHWLDLVRYAESRGHEFDYDVPNAYQYRDYVIRALNIDLPYDQFVVEHIAGDLLPQPRLHPTEGFDESILATGFWYLGEWVHSPVDIRKDECDRFDNMLDVFSKTFLGLTVACARCHEHKFDAISQSDYYALAGFLQSSAYRQVAFDTLARNRQVAQQMEDLRREYQRRLSAALATDGTELLERLDTTLLAASAALRVWSASVGADAWNLAADSDVLPEALAQQVQHAAQRTELPVAWVQYWTEHLLRAGRDARDPFWLWTQLSSRGQDDADIAALTEQWRTATSQPTADQNVTTVVDYGIAAPEQWFSDGFAFGMGPSKPGELLLDSGALAVATYGAARRDPLWTQLTLFDGVDREAAKLSGYDRVGKILRTPTFELDERPIYYLVRGSGVAYAVVDSHVMINGPLHGSLLQEFKADEQRSLQWIRQDLRRYAGHDLHIEFSPTDDGPFEVRLVVQADEPPQLIEPSAARAVIGELVRLTVTNREELATGYRDLLHRALKRLSDNSDERVDLDFAALQNELVRHSQQLAARNGEQTIDQLLQEFQAAKLQLAEQIQRRSHAAPAMWDGTGRDERLLIRGNPKTPGQFVPRRFLLAIDGDQQPTVSAGSGRLELARRVVDPDNPFFSRVYVNRLWHHLLGRGLVASTDNFGVLGELPTHPQLLDHLAISFRQEGFSTKRMIRRIVLSSTYRMSSSAIDARAEELDPQNKLWHRSMVRRLEGEVIRDALLTVSGRLDRTLYGRSVPVYLTPFMQGRGRPSVSGAVDGGGRRSIYVAVRRNFLSPMMLAFDTPQPFSTVGRRSSSNVPAQALILMNDPFVAEQCQQWAQRLLEGAEAASSSIDQRITRLYESAFARPPSAEELAAARDFLVTQARELGIAADESASDVRVWTDLCHVLVNVKEFIFIR